MKSMSKDALRLWFSSTSRLKVLMQVGKKPDKEFLMGEYLGLNVGRLPEWFGFQ